MAIVLITLITLGLFALIAPDLVLQIAIRGGLVAGGVALTLALRPDDAPTHAGCPSARTV